MLIQASDGSERGKTKLHAPEGEEAYIGCLRLGKWVWHSGANVRYTPRLRLVDSGFVL